MFRKKKDPDEGTGYNRISRMIEERKRELGDEESGLEEDTIRFNPAEHEANQPEEAEETVSLLSVRSPYLATDAPAPAETQAATEPDEDIPVAQAWEAGPHTDD